MRVVRLSIIALLAATATAAAAQERLVWTATCAAGGRTVYLERFLDRPNSAQEQEVSRRNPGAMCVFLAPEDSSPMPLQGVMEGVRMVPNDAISLPLVPRAQPVGIDAALRALRGESLPVNVPSRDSPTREAPGIEISVAPPPPAALAMRPASSGWVRLSVYAGATSEDALADWDRIVREEPAFSPFRPDIAMGQDGSVMLSAGPVSASEMPGVCLAALAMRLDCMPGAPAASDPYVEAVRALSRSYPGSLATPVAEKVSGRIPLVEQVAGRHGDSLSCPTSSLSLAKSGDGLDLIGWAEGRAEVVASAKGMQRAVAILPPQKRPGARRAKSSSGASRPFSISPMSSSTLSRATTASSESK